MATPKTVSFYTLGCKLNYSETSGIERQFEAAGYASLPFDQGADIVVINTCSVTDFADKKCRQIVRKSLRNNPNTLVVMVGCYAQLKPAEIADIEGVDLVLGAAEKFNILNYIETLEKTTGKGMIQAGEVTEAKDFVNSFSFGDRTRSFLKVQDGCDYKCSFCTIPLARGKSRSDTVQNVVENARKIGAKGVREIVLTGVNIGDFGNGTEVIEGTKPKKEALFIDLIEALDEVENIDRFRISSIEPNLCTEEIIAFVAQSKRFVPHFHMPLQSANDKQLRQMQRRYNSQLYLDRVQTIKKYMSHACIGVDVIVGFPGETDDDFLLSYQTIESMDISYLHVFTYSERTNTKALEMGEVVPIEKRRKRNQMLSRLSDTKKRQFYEQFLGQTRPVLLEKSKKEGFLTGFTDNYIKVEVLGHLELVNRIMPIHLESITDNLRVASSFHNQSVIS